MRTAATRLRGGVGVRSGRRRSWTEGAESDKTRRADTSGGGPFLTSYNNTPPYRPPETNKQTNKSEDFRVSIEGRSSNSFPRMCSTCKTDAKFPGSVSRSWTARAQYLRHAGAKMSVECTVTGGAGRVCTV